MGSLLAYAGTLRSPFIGDDYEMLRYADRGWAPVRWLTEAGPGGHTRPVAVASFWVSHWLGGSDSFGYHLVNALLHGLVAWLVVLVADGLLAQPGRERLRRRVPLLAGIVFVVSPTHAEAVSWVVCRVDLLVTGCCLLALLCWARARERSGGWRWAAVGWFVVALGTKESALTLPLVLVAYDLWLPGIAGRRATLRQGIAALAACGALVAAYLLRYSWLNGSFLSDEEAALGSAGPLLVARRGLQLVARTVLPGMNAAIWVLVLAASIVAVLVAVVGARGAATRADLRAQGSTFGFLATATVVLVAPVARLGAGAFVPTGGRLSYLPSAFATIGLVLALAVVVQARAPRRELVVAVAGIAVFTLALLAVNASYGRAGSAVEREVASASGWPQDERQVAVVTLDSVEGIPAGRNMLAPALELRRARSGSSGPAPFDELFSVDLARSTATVSVHRGSCPRCIRLHLDDPDSRFIPLPVLDAPRVVELPGGRFTLVDDHTIEIEPARGSDPATWWMLSDGRLVPVGTP